MIVKGLLWLHNLFSILCDLSSFFLLMVFEMFFLAESAPRKVKSLHALFALATEVLRLFGDFADQVGRESGWTSRFCASLLWKFEIHVTLLYCMTSIIYNIWYMYIHTYNIYIYIYTHCCDMCIIIYGHYCGIYIYIYIYILCNSARQVVQRELWKDEKGCCMNHKKTISLGHCWMMVRQGKSFVKDLISS